MYQSLTTCNFEIVKYLQHFSVTRAHTERSIVLSINQIHILKYVESMELPIHNYKKGMQLKNLVLLHQKQLVPSQQYVTITMLDFFLLWCV